MPCSFSPENLSPENLSPERRMAELTDLLALGVGRVLALRAARVDSPDSGSSQKPSESSPNRLDECPQTRLHVPRG
jgi:hypothetical protein